MNKDNSFDQHIDNSDTKADKRDKKKRKKMPVSGKSVFEILKIKKERSK